MTLDRPIRPTAAMHVTAPTGIVAPAVGYLNDLILVHERLVGTRARTKRDTGSTRTNVQAGRTLDDITRAIRTYRKLLGDPRIPAAYKKTTQVVRAGQAIFADICLRLPAVLAAKPMQCKADPLNDQKESQEAATLKEEWISAMLLGQDGRRAVLDSGKTSVWRDWMDNLVNVGRAAFSLSVDVDRWSESMPGFPTTADYNDDPDDIPKRRRRSAGEKYRDAVDLFKREHPPLVLESLDPLSVYIAEDDRGIEDEALLIVKRPYRDTLSRYGLIPLEAFGQKPGVMQGKEGSYIPGPEGFGRPYPVYEWDSPVIEPEYVETVTYYCSAKRARYLGLIKKDDEVDKDSGIWAQYVDGICVDGGYLPGPAWHPLPVFRSFGLSTAMADPTYQGIPAPMHLIELIAVLDQIITMELHIAAWSAWPMLVEEDKTGGGPGATGLPDDALNNPERANQPGADASAVQRTIEPGQYRKMPPGRTLRWMPLPAEATVHLERLYGHARELTDLVGLPSVFRGQGGSDQSGYAAALLNVAAKSLYDPVIENGTACVNTAAMFALWQVWKRFDEGVPVYFAGSKRKNRPAGLKIITPKDIAPDASGAGQGTPFLALSITANPMLPQDAGQREQRAILANQAGMIDKLTARETGFDDPHPEVTEARLFADKIMESPYTQAVETFRALVRAGRLVPKLAIYGLATQLGIDPQLAYDQLLARDAFTEEQIRALEEERQQVEQQKALMAAAQQPPMGGGFTPTQLPSGNELFGIPSIGGVPQTAPPMPNAPPVPQQPSIGAGGVSRAGQATSQPTPDTRTARQLAGAA